jgi:hypothetical protein
VASVPATVNSATPGGRNTGKQLGDAEKAMRACTELEAELAELHAAYDQYFLGLERRPPSEKHKAVKKLMTELRGAFVNSTPVKFRISNLQQRLNTFERLWERTLLEIENGTYKRDVFKARKKVEARKKKSASPAAVESDGLDDLHIDEDLDLSDLDGDGGDLDSAMSEAAAAVERPAPLPTVPAVRPVVSTPAIAPVTMPGVPPVSRVAPAVARGTPQRADAPTVPSVPAVSPATPRGLPTVTPAVPAVGPVASKTSTSGPLPAVTSAPPRSPTSGSLPAVTSAPATSEGARASRQAGTQAVPSLTPGSRAPSGPLHEARPSRPPAPVGSDGGLNDGKIKAIYDAFVMAKRRCGEDTSKLSLDSVATTLRSQVPSLMKQHNARSVEFKVVIKDGKAVLRALPKE